MSFEDRIREVAKSNPSAPLGWAIRMVDNELAVAPTPIPNYTSTPKECAEYAFENDVIMDLVADGKKINAIKELRGVAGIGLKEAKDAVELAEQWRREGRVSRRERLDIEAASEEAMQSIKETMAAMRAGAESAGVTIDNGGQLRIT